MVDILPCFVDIDAVIFFCRSGVLKVYITLCIHFMLAENTDTDSKTNKKKPSPIARSAKLILKLRQRIVTMMRRRSASVAPASVLHDQNASAGQEHGPEGDPPASDSGPVPGNECAPDIGLTQDNNGNDVSVDTDVNSRGDVSDVMEWGAPLDDAGSEL